MSTKISPALVSKRDDLKKLRSQQFGVWQWGKDLHRYAVILVIKGQNLVFQGMDVRELRDVEETIPFDKITGISLGLDEQSKGNNQGSFMQNETKPLVVRYKQNGDEETDYFVTNFPGLSSRVDGNHYWYETLKAAIDHTN